MSNQAYIFDMDGVLADNCRYHVLAWRVFSKKHGFELTDEQVLEWMGAANRVYMERLLGRPVADDELAALNRLCQWLVGEDALEINYHGMKPANIDQLAKVAAHVEKCNNPTRPPADLV